MKREQFKKLVKGIIKEYIELNEDPMPRVQAEREAQKYVKNTYDYMSQEDGDETYDQLIQAYTDGYIDGYNFGEDKYNNGYINENRGAEYINTIGPDWEKLFNSNKKVIPMDSVIDVCSVVDDSDAVNDYIDKYVMPDAENFGYTYDYNQDAFIKDVNEFAVMFETKDSNYKEFFKKMMKQHNFDIKTASEEEKRNFFLKIDRLYKSKSEKK